MSRWARAPPSALKSGAPQVAQQFPARQAKNASMSASVPAPPSLLKSAELTVSVAGALTTLPQPLDTTHRNTKSPELKAPWPDRVRVGVVDPLAVKRARPR